MFAFLTHKWVSGRCPLHRRTQRLLRTALSPWEWCHQKHRTNTASAPLSDAQSPSCLLSTALTQTEAQVSPLSDDYHTFVYPYLSFSGINFDFLELTFIYTPEEARWYVMCACVRSHVTLGPQPESSPCQIEPKHLVKGLCFIMCIVIRHHKLILECWLCLCRNVIINSASSEGRGKLNMKPGHSAR